MSVFVCPVCREKLNSCGGSLRCPKGHSYDLAKAGYVNLLMAQSSKSKRHGDDKAMVAARKRFLEKGYYSPLLDGLVSLLSKFIKDGDTLADLGCGEGWYSRGILKFAGENGMDIALAGVDISKCSAAFAAKSLPSAEIAVASTSSLPLGNESCDICLCVFAPFSMEEVRRVLRTGGRFVRAFPLEDHLIGLKKLVYDSVYANKVRTAGCDGFAVEDRLEIRSVLRLDNKQDIADLFMMTPYYYKTSRAGQEKVAAVSELETPIEFGIEVMRKQ